MLSVLIPAYNEEDRIADTIGAVRALPEVSQVLVVDDGSSDQTVQRATAGGAEVLRLGANLGKGEAMNRGVRLLSEHFVALLDGDLGRSASQLSLLAAPVLHGDADLAIACFPPMEKAGGFGLVKGLACRGIHLLTGLKVTAPLSGQRVMRREVLDVVVPFAGGYGVEVAMTIRAARAGFRIVEVPTEMTHSVTGRDIAGFRHRGQQFWHVFWSLVRVGRQGWRQ